MSSNLAYLFVWATGDIILPSCYSHQYTDVERRSPAHRFSASYLMSTHKHAAFTNNLHFLRVKTGKPVPAYYLPDPTCTHGKSTQPVRAIWCRTPLFHVTILATLCIKGLNGCVDDVGGTGATGTLLASGRRALHEDGHSSVVRAADTVRASARHGAVAADRMSARVDGRAATATERPIDDAHERLSKMRVDGAVE